MYNPNNAIIYITTYTSCYSGLSETGKYTYPEMCDIASKFAQLFVSIYTAIMITDDTINKLTKINHDLCSGKYDGYILTADNIEFMTNTLKGMMYATDMYTNDVMIKALLTYLHVHDYIVFVNS